MIKLAITGNIASGKTLVESLLQEQGILTIDTDEIVHKLLSEDANVIEKVNNLFDIDVKDLQGRIDRKKVGNIVFNDQKKLKELENILHPEVKKLVDKFYEDNKNQKIIAVSVPQLYETSWEIYFDYVLLVVANDETRFERLIVRNGISEENAKKRISLQISQAEKIKKADFVINNSGDAENTRLQLKIILKKLEKI